MHCVADQDRILRCRKYIIDWVLFKYALCCWSRLYPSMSQIHHWLGALQTWTMHFVADQDYILRCRKYIIDWVLFKHEHSVADRDRVLCCIYITTYIHHYFSQQHFTSFQQCKELNVWNGNDTVWLKHWYINAIEIILLMYKYSIKCY